MNPFTGSSSLPRNTGPSLDPRARAFFRRFLDELGYDANYRYLEVNEFQAYLMQQPQRFAPEYFQRVMARFGGRGARVPVQVIVEASRRLDAFLQAHFGIRAGETIAVPAAHGVSG